LPVCPDHPDTHPLTPLATKAGLVWVWPRSERSVSAVGQIRAAEVSVPVETER